MKLGEFIVFKVKSLLVSLGLILFGLTFAILGGTDVLSGTANWPRVDAEIINVDHNHKRTYVKYKVNGKSYETKINFYSSSHNKGQIIQIKYNPNDPSDTYAVTPIGFNLAFIIPGSVVATIGILLPVRTIFAGIYTRKKVTTINNEEQLDFVPMFLLEYKALDDIHQEKYSFDIDKDDKKNFKVIDSKGETIFYTRCIRRYKHITTIYQLVDRFNKESSIIKIRKTFFNSQYENNGFKVLVDNKSLNRYFLERHITYDYKKENNNYIFNMYHNGDKIASISNAITTVPYLLVNNKPIYKASYHYDIITMKENIDDAALFILCLTYR